MEMQTNKAQETIENLQSQLKKLEGDRVYAQLEFGKSLSNYEKMKKKHADEIALHEK